MGNRIYLASPTMHQEEQVFIQEAFDTNWVAPLGKNVDEFEKGVAEFVGVKSAAALNAGTAALHLAVKLAGVRRGDKVFCSDLTFSATVNPVSYEGGEQVFIDSERETWNMDPRALERAFERYPDCRCVIAANLYGTPAKLDEIRDICDAHGAVFIEDAAESLSATYKGRQTGTFGQYNALSFNGNKIITTSGGGMLLSDDEAGTCIIEMPDEIIDASAATQIHNIRSMLADIPADETESPPNPEERSPGHVPTDDPPGLSCGNLQPDGKD